MKLLSEYPLHIRQVLTGSPTPGSDLSAMIDRKEITESEALEAINHGLRPGDRTTVEAQRKLEVRFSVMYDC